MPRNPGCSLHSFLEPDGRCSCGPNDFYVGLVHETTSKARRMAQLLQLKDIDPMGYGQSLRGKRYIRLYLMMDLEHGNKEDRQYYAYLLTLLNLGGEIICLV